MDTNWLSSDSTTFWAFSLPSPIDYLSYYVSLIHGQPKLHKFTSSQRDTYRFHRVTQSFPLLEWHCDLAPSPVVIAGSTLFISQNLLCLLQFLKSLHWKTNQKMSITLLEGLFKTPKQSLLLTSCVTLDQFQLLTISFLICKVNHKDKWDYVWKVPGSQFIHSLYWAPVMCQVLLQVLMTQVWKQTWSIQWDSHL